MSEKPFFGSTSVYGLEFGNTYHTFSRECVHSEGNDHNPREGQSLIRGTSSRDEEGRVNRAQTRGRKYRPLVCARDVIDR